MHLPQSCRVQGVGCMLQGAARLDLIFLFQAILNLSNFELVFKPFSCHHSFFFLASFYGLGLLPFYGHILAPINPNPNSNPNTKSSIFIVFCFINDKKLT